MASRMEQPFSLFLLGCVFSYSRLNHLHLYMREITAQRKRKIITCWCIYMLSESLEFEIHHHASPINEWIILHNGVVVLSNLRWQQICNGHIEFCLKFQWPMGFVLSSKVDSVSFCVWTGMKQQKVVTKLGFIIENSIQMEAISVTYQPIG